MEKETIVGACYCINCNELIVWTSELDEKKTNKLRRKKRKYINVIVECDKCKKENTVTYRL